MTLALITVVAPFHQLSRMLITALPFTALVVAMSAALVALSQPTS